MSGLDSFLKVRDFLLSVKSYAEAVDGFEWPDLSKFNWATDYFDHMARGNFNLAVICTDGGEVERKVTFDEMRRKSNQVANFLRDLGLQKGDRVFMIMDSSVDLLELMLGIMKAGGVIIPGATLLPSKDIADRIERGNIKFVIANDEYAHRVLEAGNVLSRLKAMINVGDDIEHVHDDEDIPSFINYKNAEKYSEEYEPPFITYSNDPLFLFFTSGTTAKPKLVTHTHIYPVGHLTTMYWIGLQKGDIHYNISSPGWGKYAWSSFYAPWNAESTVVLFRYKRFEARSVLKVMEKYRVTTLCAPLSALKLLTIEDLSAYNLKLREVVSAGEPLIPDVVKRVESALGVDVREGYGQTETTLSVGNFKGEPRKNLSFGKPAPGYHVDVLNNFLDELGSGEDGQLCVKTFPTRPLGLMQGYDDEELNRNVFKGNWYLSGDSVYKDEDGYFYFIGRTDDVFKSLDYRISPFEVESELSVHPAVLEAGVIPTEDERGRIVPKAFVILKPDYKPSREVALDIFRFIRNNMAPYKRPRSIEFLREFKKTISAKLMRKSLREYEASLREQDKRGEFEFKESDFEKELDLTRRN